MKLQTLLLFAGVVAVGFLATYARFGRAQLNAVYTDRRGKTWRVPTEGLVTKATNFVIESVPRLSKSFSIVSPDFDLESDEYVYSSVMYIVLVGAVGLLFLLCIILFFLIRYACGCCGGRKLPRRGYSQSEVTCTRMTLVIFSFLFEGVVIYGYFANTDLHSSLTTLVDVFTDVGTTLRTQMGKLIESLPKDSTGNTVYDKYQEDFKKDMEFSTRFASGQGEFMKDVMGRFEGLRMAMILTSLTLATIGCAIGIAAGSVNKGIPVIIMIILNTVAGTIIFFSAGAHFAGSKIVYEYCDEMDYYLELGNAEVIPTRLQFFMPCIASPVFPFIQDYYAINSILLIDDFTAKMKGTNVWNDEKTKLQYSPAHWFNVTDEFYPIQIEKLDDEAKKTEAQTAYDKAVNFTNLLLILDENAQCAYSKSEMRAEHFLMCKYMKDNLDMLTMSQAVGGVLLLIITFSGIPAIREFEWAGRANLGGILNGQKKFSGKKARPKRKVNE